jgi:hypothetical protein
MRFVQNYNSACKSKKAVCKSTNRPFSRNSDPLLLDAELSKQTPLLDPEAACLLCAGSRKLQNNRLLGLIHEGL